MDRALRFGRFARPAILVAPGVALMLSSMPATSRGTPDTRPPNVIIILADDLGTADLSRQTVPQPVEIVDGGVEFGRPGRRRDGPVSYLQPDAPRVANLDALDFGYTPQIDRIFEQGIELTQYLTHTLCSPSRAGLLTGRHYTRVGSGPQTEGTLRLDIENVARDLQSDGFVAGAFGKWHNGYPNFPADGNGALVVGRDQTDPGNGRFENYKGIPWGPGVNAYGFDEWQGFYGGAVDYFDRYSSWHNDRNWWTDRRYTPDEPGHTVDIVAAAAVDFIVRHRDRPFFCYLSMPAPHEPVQVLRSDLEAVSSRLPGAWERLRDLVSPVSGRRLGDVEELRCGRGEEFDHTVLDPEGSYFYPLARAALIHAMDRGIGDVLTALETLGLSRDTIVWMMSDNGGNALRSSKPWRGGKGSLYEGGIRVPAAVWWRGTLDALSPAYAIDNSYPHLFQYLDVYPTTMAMIGLEPSADDLDGQDGFAALLARSPTHPLEESTYISFNNEWAVVRSGRWKLLYNEAGSRQRVELYNLHQDPGEKFDVKDDHAEIWGRLAADLHGFINQGHLAMSYFPPRADWVSSATPSPDGDILEVVASQTSTIDDGDIHGLFVRFATAGITDYAVEQLAPSDLFSFDLYVAADSDHTSGFFVTPGRGSTPVFDSSSGVTAEGQLIATTSWPRERWVRVTLGIGEIAPLSQAVDYIALRSPDEGSYHFFLDNVAVLRADGSTKAVIWGSKDDSLPLLYHYSGATYESWDSVSAVGGFPFSQVQIR